MKYFFFCIKKDNMNINSHRENLKFIRGQKIIIQIAININLINFHFSILFVHKINHVKNNIQIV